MPRLILDFVIVSGLLLGSIFMVVSKDAIQSKESTSGTITPELSQATDLPAFSPITFHEVTRDAEEKNVETQVAISPSEKKEKPPIVESPATVVAPVTKALSVPPIVTATEPAGSLSDASTKLREALVNIVCYTPNGSRVNSISGSGVFIDPKGIILTNAHIAQYLLLHQQGVTCTVRTGAPAIDSYKASLVFISSAWIQENAKLLMTAMPVGTGENDFALLAVTKSASTVGKPLPDTFPFIPLSDSVVTAGTPVVIGGYGAQFLGGEQIQFFLNPTLVFGLVKDVFTFKTNTVDVMSLGGSAAAQQGSSGGGVADANGKLIGTIVTSTQEKTTAERTLDAITATYMRGAYATEVGEPIDTLFSRPVETSISNFESRKKELEAILSSALQ